MKITQYALQVVKTGELLHFEIRSNGEAENCNPTSCYLVKPSSGIATEVWLTDQSEVAEWVRHNSTPWYNADRNQPNHSFTAAELAVVKYEMTVTISPVTVQIPTTVTMMDFLDQLNHEKMPRKVRCFLNAVKHLDRRKVLSLVLRVKRWCWEQQPKCPEKNENGSSYYQDKKMVITELF